MPLAEVLQVADCRAHERRARYRLGQAAGHPGPCVQEGHTGRPWPDDAAGVDDRSRDLRPGQGGEDGLGLAHRDVVGRAARQHHHHAVHPVVGPGERLDVEQVAPGVRYPRHGPAAHRPHPGAPSSQLVGHRAPLRSCGAVDRDEGHRADAVSAAMTAAEPAQS